MRRIGNHLPGPREISAVAARSRRASRVVLLLCACIPADRIPAQQIAAQLASAQQPATPDTPAPQANPPATEAPVQTIPGTLHGTVTDRDGASIPGARITFTRTPSASEVAVTITTASAQDGTFAFPNLPAGSFTLAVTAAGFTPRQTVGEIRSGETAELPPIALIASTFTDVQVTATQTEIAEAQINIEEKQRILDFFPNFYVSYIPDPVPLDPKQKFELAWKTVIDPVSLVLNGVTAGAQQADNTYSWGQGTQGYAKRYAAAYGTFMTGTFLGSAILPILFKQDPRYFYKGTGSIHSRAGYAIANAVICKGDNHRWQPNYSAILGGIAAGGISNLYYPAVNRSGAGLTFEGAAIGTGIAAISNLLQEFLIRKLTPHIPKNLATSP
jgi:hypothetical protein